MYHLALSLIISCHTIYIFYIDLYDIYTIYTINIFLVFRHRFFLLWEPDTTSFEHNLCRLKLVYLSAATTSRHIQSKVHKFRL
jgi:hypothetical protein